MKAEMRSTMETAGKVQVFTKAHPVADAGPNPASVITQLDRSVERANALIVQQAKGTERKEHRRHARPFAEERDGLPIDRPVDVPRLPRSLVAVVSPQALGASPGSVHSGRTSPLLRQPPTVASTLASNSLEVGMGQAQDLKTVTLTDYLSAICRET